MGLFKSKEEKQIAKEEKQKKSEEQNIFVGKSLQQIGKIAIDFPVGISLNPEEKTLRLKSGETIITLPYNRVKGFKLDREADFVKSGSAIGRALVGGALFGAAGAIVGANSAGGKTENKWIGTLTYEDKEGNQQELSFLQMGALGIYSSKDKHFGAAKFESNVNRIASENAEDITEL